MSDDLLIDLGNACRAADHDRVARLALDLHVAALMRHSLPGALPRPRDAATIADRFPALRERAG